MITIEQHFIVCCVFFAQIITADYNYHMKNNNISISQVFWSVPNLEFANNILSLGLKIKKIKSSGEYFNTYQLSNGTKIIAYVEHNNDNFKIHDSCLNLSTSRETIILAYQIIKLFNYSCHFTDSKITMLHIFAPSPNKWCEIIINN